jgi:predicted Zn finger-like uncharacterized protein
MRNLISGVVGVLFGGAILLYGLSSPRGAGAFAAGQMMGMVFGALFLGGGVFYLVQAAREWSDRDWEQEPKRRKRRRRPAVAVMRPTSEASSDKGGPSATSITCPECQSALRVPPDSPAGKRFRCAKCGAVARVPGKEE